MNEPSQIEAKLHAEADKKLRAELETAAEPFFQIAREGCSSLYGIEMTHNGSKANGYQVMIALKEHIFKQLCESRRKRAVDQFMEQVESLAQDVEELKNAVHR